MRGAPIFFLAALAGLGSIAAAPARADQAFETVQLACVPDAGYVSIARRWMWDIAPPSSRRSQSIALVAPDALWRKPFTCRWKDHAVVVRAVHAESNDSQLPCFAIEPVGLEVMLDGKHLACLEGTNSANDDGRQTLTLNEDGLAENGSILAESCSADMHPDAHGEKDVADAGRLVCRMQILGPAWKNANAHK